MIFTLIILSWFLSTTSADTDFDKGSIEWGISLYQPYEQVDLQKKELAFWENKVKAAPQQFVFQQQLAQANETMFKLTADIQYLKASEGLLFNLSQKALPGKASILRSLAHNYISQHRFKEALNLVNQAIENGSNKKASQLMLIDIYEELGMEVQQKTLLDQFADQRDFNYLIRLAKWEDGQGRLENTIALMKEAEVIVESGKQETLMAWVYSNLGDYYGHAGKIDLSEKYYTKSLKLNPADWYSMKGLAWIAYSHEKDMEKAIKILSLINRNVSDPSVTLLQAEIMEYQKKVNLANTLKNKVEKQVSQPEYGVMYNHFLTHFYAENPKTVPRAFEIANLEITGRAVPASYDLLAYVHYKNGETKKAQKLSERFILNKTYEPGILINQVYYFKKNNNSEIELIKNEIPDAQFELGPLAYEQYTLFIQS